MRKNRNECDRNPGRGIGAFLIAFGLLLAVVMMDLLQLGSPGEYIKWQMLLLFIGVVSLFNGKIGEAVILGAVGTYFLLPDLNVFIPEFVENFYWPAAIILVGLAFIISGIIRRARSVNL